MASGLIERRVKRDHEIQIFQRLIEGRTIRRGQHRISRAGKHEANLSVSWRANLVNHRRGGKFIVKLRQPPAPTAESGKPTGAGIRDLIHGR